MAIAEIIYIVFIGIEKPIGHTSYATRYKAIRYYVPFANTT